MHFGHYLELKKKLKMMIKNQQLQKATELLAEF